MAESQHNVRIEDVARRANVAASTVSRAFKNCLVHPQTRERILAIANEMGYRPNQTAAALARGNTQTIGLILPELDNPYFGEMAREFERQIHHTNYHLMLHSLEDDLSLMFKYLDRLIVERRVDGLLVAPIGGLRTNEYMARLSHCGVAQILLGQSNCPEIPGVNVNFTSGACLATEHLLNLGHRRIAYLAGVRRIDGEWQYHEAQSRLDGYRQAHLKHGVRVQDSLIRYCGLELEDAHRATLELLDQEPSCTAIISTNDMQALAIQNAAAERSRSVPGDLSLIGCDNIRLAQYVGLTTVDSHTPTFVKLCLDRIIQMISGDNADQPRNMSVEPTLIMRRTTAPPRPGARANV